MSSTAIGRLTSRSRWGWLCIVFVISERASYHESGAECSNEFPEPARNWVDVRKKSRSGKSVRTFRAIFAQHGADGHTWGLQVACFQQAVWNHPLSFQKEPVEDDFP